MRRNRSLDEFKCAFLKSLYNKGRMDYLSWCPWGYRAVNTKISGYQKQNAFA